MKGGESLKTSLEDTVQLASQDLFSCIKRLKENETSAPVFIIEEVFFLQFYSHIKRLIMPLKNTYFIQAGEVCAHRMHCFKQMFQCRDTPHHRLSDLFQLNEDWKVKYSRRSS